jgi:hypothetical protein
VLFSVAINGDLKGDALITSDLTLIESLILLFTFVVLFSHNQEKTKKQEKEISSLKRELDKSLKDYDKMEIERLKNEMRMAAQEANKQQKKDSINNQATNLID